MNNKPTILDVRDLHAGYDGSEVLHGISFEVHEGEFICIAGPNGAGKSTLLHVLAALKTPTQGSITLLDRPLAQYPSRLLAQHVAVVFQDSRNLYDFTVFDLVAMGRSPFLTRWKPLSADDRITINQALQMTEMSNLRNRLLCELSGGERQRAIIAKALAQDPSLLLLDEPSTHLDLHHQMNVFAILQRLNQQRNVTILCITHDLTLAAQFADRFLLLSDGWLLADGDPEQVVQQPIMERLFATSICVGVLSETNTPYVYPVRR